jgi:hypothetical protein
VDVFIDLVDSERLVQEIKECEALRKRVKKEGIVKVFNLGPEPLFVQGSNHNDYYKLRGEYWKRYFEADYRVSPKRLTMLYSILAHSRGHLHCKKARMAQHSHCTYERTLEDQSKQIGDQWHEFV